jgi:ubiquinone/menaquinone biosynthesis C-methylase UbiE
MSTDHALQDAMADSAIHEQWVAAYRTPEARGFYEMAFDEIAARLNAPPDAAILDAGCGSCAKSILLASRGFRVVAADFSEDALGLAARTIAARGLQDRISTRQGDLLELPFRDGEFPYVLCWGVLMHVPDVRRALSELARVLAPGGRLVLSEGNMRAVQAVALRSLKRLLGRGRGRVIRTAAGLETHEDTARGKLLTRQTDMAWLTAECDRLGLSLNARLAGQFTELYVLAPWPWLRRLIHGLNHAWFRHVGLPGPAFGNILIFEKKR